MTELSISGFHIDSNIKFNYKSNPKRNGCMAYKRYEEYSQANNIDDYLNITKDTKFGKADLRYDVEHFHLSLVKDGVILNQPQEQEQEQEHQMKEVKEDEFIEELDDIDDDFVMTETD